MRRISARKLWGFVVCQFRGHRILAGSQPREDGKVYCVRCGQYVQMTAVYRELAQSYLKKRRKNC